MEPNLAEERCWLTIVGGGVMSVCLDGSSSWSSGSPVTCLGHHQVNCTLGWFDQISPVVLWLYYWMVCVCVFVCIRVMQWSVNPSGVNSCLSPGECWDRHQHPPLPPLGWAVVGWTWLDGISEKEEATSNVLLKWFDLCQFRTKNPAILL